jgi:hypothetical protein
MKKRGWEVKPINAEDLEQLAKEVLNQRPDAIDWLKKLYDK